MAVYTKTTVFLISLVTLLVAGCQRQVEESSDRLPESRILERVEEVAVISLDAPAFEGLTKDEKLLASHISEAILAGRDIPYDQIHAKNLEVRRFIEEISLGLTYGAREKYVDPFWLFLKKLWIYNGFYDLCTLKKISPPVDERILGNLMFVALSNTGGQLGELPDINEKFIWIKENVHNPSVDPVLFSNYTVNHNPSYSTPVNFYEDIALDEIANFKPKYRQNSKVALVDDQLR